MGNIMISEGGGFLIDWDMCVCIGLGTQLILLDVPLDWNRLLST